MKLSKEFMKIIEAEDNEQGDVILTMLEQPDITFDEIFPEAVEFLTDRSDYDGNIWEVNKYVTLNILADDEDDVWELADDENVVWDEDDDKFTLMDISDWDTSKATDVDYADDDYDE